MCIMSERQRGTAMQTTKTTKTTNKRQSREGQRNARAELAYRTLRYTGGKPGDATMEQWTAPSTSQANTEYTVTHDLAHDLYRCSCLAGQHDRECVHVLAAKRTVDQRRAADASYAMLYGDYTSY